MPNKTKNTRKTVGIRLSDSEKQFLDNKYPNVTSGEAVRQMIENFKSISTPPKNLEEAQEKINYLLGDLSLDFKHSPRSVVVEDIIREATLILATAMVYQGQDKSKVDIDILDSKLDNNLDKENDDNKGKSNLKNKEKDKEENVDKRLEYEAQIVDRAFDLTDSIFRHALPKTSSSLNPDIVRQRWEKSKDLLISTLAQIAKDNPPSSKNNKK